MSILSVALFILQLLPQTQSNMACSLIDWYQIFVGLGKRSRLLGENKRQSATYFSIDLYSVLFH